MQHWTLTPRQLCDIECLLTGAFAPLTGFLGKDDYHSVCKTMRLADGRLWPMPITLDVFEAFAKTCTIGETLILTDSENKPLASLLVSDIWQPNKAFEAQHVYGTTDKTHPGVAYLYDTAGDWYIGGQVEAISLPVHDDFIAYRHTPLLLKQQFELYGWSKIVAFQTRNPIHRAHFELTQHAARLADANLLLHPVVGMSKPGDINYFLRVRCYLHVLKHYPKSMHVMLSLLPLAMRMAGPKEAVWHAIIRKNYGVTHFIVGRDHAGPGVNTKGQAFYEPEAAQVLLQQYADEIEMQVLTFPELLYVKHKQAFVFADSLDENTEVEKVSGTMLRNALRQQDKIPDWFSFPEVLETLKVAYPPKHEQGFTLFFTGLSGAGKSTLARAVQAKFLEDGLRTVSLLDGDVVRKNLSSDLGFSKKDRDIQVKRLGYIASEITKHRGIAICAAIAPYAQAREAVRTAVEQYGTFIEIYVATPLATCKSRDVKGLYQKAEEGSIQGVTGIDAPYEVPENAALVLDTSVLSKHQALVHIFDYLKAQELYGKTTKPYSVRVSHYL